MLHLRFVCLAFVFLLLPALAQACPANPNPPINITETSVTKQNSAFCQGQTVTYDEIEDTPVFAGACLVAIKRTIKHVTEVSAGTATTCPTGGGGSVKSGGTTITSSTTTSTSSSSETKQNPNLCQGETRNYDVVLTKVTVMATVSTTSIGSFTFGTNIHFNSNTNTHTLRVNEVGTKECVMCLPNPPVMVIAESNVTRESPNLCQGQSDTFDEFQDTPTYDGNCVLEIRRTIVHVTQVGTRDCVSDPFPVNCLTACFASADRIEMLLRQGKANLALDTVWYLGTPVMSNSHTVLRTMLDQNYSLRLRFGREYLAVQLSLLRAPSWDRERVKDGALECQGVTFAPITLSNGVTLTKKSTLRMLLQEAQRLSTLGLALDESRDAAAVLEILQRLNRCM